MYDKGLEGESEYVEVKKRKDGTIVRLSFGSTTYIYPNGTRGTIHYHIIPRLSGKAEKRFLRCKQLYQWREASRRYRAKQKALKQAQQDQTA